MMRSLAAALVLLLAPVAMAQAPLKPERVSLGFTETTQQTPVALDVLRTEHGAMVIGASAGDVSLALIYTDTVRLDDQRYMGVLRDTLLPNLKKPAALFQVLPAGGADVAGPFMGGCGARPPAFLAIEDSVGRVGAGQLHADDTVRLYVIDVDYGGKPPIWKVCRVVELTPAK